MKCRGKFNDLTRNYKGEWVISFTLSDSPKPAAIDELKTIDNLDIEAKKHREKRSLDANAYAWVLIQKLAEATGADKWSVYMKMLQEYSRKFTHVIVKPEAVEPFKQMFRACVDLGEVTVNGKTGHQLQAYYGSSTFDSKEMSVFINGIVYECKELGIETLTPAEIERMNAQWGMYETT